MINSEKTQKLKIIAIQSNPHVTRGHIRSVRVAPSFLLIILLSLCDQPSLTAVKVVQVMRRGTRGLDGVGDGGRH